MLIAHLEIMNTSLLNFAGGLQLLEGLEVTVVVPVVLAGICLIGLVGNLLVSVVLINNLRQGKCSVVNALAINLGAADLLIILFCIPFRAITYSKQSWVFGSFVCRTTDWFLHSCLLAKSFTLAAMGQARYNYVLNPPKYFHVQPKRIAGLVFIIWTISVVLPVPHIVFTSLRQGHSGALCIFQVPFYASNFINVFSKIYPALAYVIPFVFTAVCYAKTFLKAKLKRNRTPNPRPHGKRVTLMLSCLSCAYALLWLPEWVAWIWERHSYKEQQKPPTALMILAQVLVFVSCTVNPMILLSMSDEIRDGLASAWSLITCRGTRDSGETRSPKTGENGAEMGSSVIHSLQDAQTQDKTEIAKDKAGIVLPDVEHFWQDRRNTTAVEDNDPIPWEHQ
ncbi:G-protein coupled receptor 151-like [Polypterus senegalus]